MMHHSDIQVVLKALTRIVAIFFFVMARSAVADTTLQAYQPGQSYHSIGTRVGLWKWGATKSVGAGFLTDGRYSRKFQNGALKAIFVLSTDNNSADDAVIGYIDVFDDLSRREIARREIHRKEFDHTQSPQPFELSFVTLEKNKLRFRLYVFGNSDIEHWSTTVTQEMRLTREALFVFASSRQTHALNSRWNDKNGQAALELIRIPYSPPAPGNYRTRFALRIDDNVRDNTKVATLDVFNRSSNIVLATVTLNRRLFLAPSRVQIFELPFAYDGEGEVELRVFTFGNARLENVSETVDPAARYFYIGSDARLSHQIGHARGSVWVNDLGSGSGYLTYGPATISVPPGVTTVIFNLSIDDNLVDNETVARIEAYDAGTDRILARRIIKRRDFTAASSPQEFDLVFDLARVSSLEWRVVALNSAILQHNSTTVEPDRLTLTALWNKRAHFEFRKRDVFTADGNTDSNTSSLSALDGTWYAFNREPARNLNPKQLTKCDLVGRSLLQVVVRKSTDRGVTWSDPVVIAAPSEVESAPDFCEIVDGGAFFDPETDTWHYLGQCLNETSNWNLCHYTREGSSPLGLFDRDSANPVVIGGQLWNKICSRNTNLCPVDMRDEGTPQIITKNGDGYFYVTFHGAEYADINIGARGAARTMDFSHWQTVANDLPGSAMLSIRDCQQWRANWKDGTCIGEGAGKILRSGMFDYTLVEAADRTLACRPEQIWVFGLLRNSWLGPSGTWQNYPDNPYVRNENRSPVGCSLQYMNLIRDRGELFLEFSLYTPDYYFPNYIFQLVDGAGKSSALLVK
jgi:hypothetical protein